MRHIQFFSGAPNCGFGVGGGKKFMLKKSMCFFCPLTKASMEVPTKVSTQVVGVHLSCFHLFCSSTNDAWMLTSLCRPPEALYDERGKRSLGVLGGFPWFYLNTKEWKIGV